MARKKLNEFGIVHKFADKVGVVYDSFSTRLVKVKGEDRMIITFLRKKVEADFWATTMLKMLVDNNDLPKSGCLIAVEQDLGGRKGLAYELEDDVKLWKEFDVIESLQ